MDETIDTSLNAIDSVDISCNSHIKAIFDTLFLEHQKIQQNLADYLGVDKAYVSRVVNGLQIPPLKTRLKIASFFNTDSSLIWRVKDMDFIRDILIKQKEEKNDN